MFGVPLELVGEVVVVSLERHVAFMCRALHGGIASTRRLPVETPSRRPLDLVARDA